MLKLLIALIATGTVMTLGYQDGALVWVSAAVICAVLETALFNNVIFFIPSAAAGAGAFAQFFTGDAKTALMAALVFGAGTLMLLYKELTQDKKAEEQAKLTSLKKVRGY